MTIKPQPGKSHARITRASKPSSRPLPEVCAYPVRRFAVNEYHRMIDAGFFAEDERYELINGWIIAKARKSPPHAATCNLTEDLLRSLLPSDWRVRVQPPLTLEESEPEPDIAVVFGSAGRYADHHPGFGEIAIVIEISVSTLDFDWSTKHDVYAAARLPVYWNVNVPERAVEVHTDPVGPVGKRRYRKTTTYRDGDQLPITIEGKIIGEIAVADMFPAPV